MVERRQIDSLREFWGEVSKVHRQWVRRYTDRKQGDVEWIPWFRGEPSSRCSTVLKPTLYRPEGRKKKDFLHAEQELRLEFRRRGVQLIVGRPPADKWEWYFLMAHHGAPTRLLDWTDGALVALYFAVTSAQRWKGKEGPGDAAVYLLDPWWLNDQVFKQTPSRKKNRPEGVVLPEWEESTAYLPDELDSEDLGPRLALAIDPSHVSSRVAAQRSRFVIFGRDPKALQSMLAKDGSRLVQVLVKRVALGRIIRELEICGISESTIFPDFDGLGRELDQTWKRKYLSGDS